MADTNDLFFFGDDFDAILGILEDEEELDKQFGEAADEVSITFFLSDPKFSEKRCVSSIDCHRVSVLLVATCIITKSLSYVVYCTDDVIIERFLISIIYA